MTIKDYNVLGGVFMKQALKAVLIFIISAFLLPLCVYYINSAINKKQAKEKPKKQPTKLKQKVSKAKEKTATASKAAVSKKTTETTKASSAKKTTSAKAKKAE